MINFRKTIKAKMAKQGINTPELIRRLLLNQKLVISQQSVYDFLAGKSEMTAKNLEAILNELEAKLS